MPWLPLLATLVDFGGTLVVIAVAATCLRGFLRAGGAPAALDPLRLRLAGGLVLALSFKTGAGVIRTITVGSFHQFAALLLIVALRFFLGRVLKAQAARRAGGSLTPPTVNRPSVGPSA
jgi:uncharacterized membrane protein